MHTLVSMHCLQERMLTVHSACLLCPAAHMGSSGCGHDTDLYAQGVPSRQADPSDTGPEFKTAPRTIHVQVAMAAWFLALTSQALLAFRHPFFYALANGHPGVSRPPQLWFCPLLLVKALTGDFSGPFFWGPVSCSLCPRMVQFSLESSLRTLCSSRQRPLLLLAAALRTERSLGARDSSTAEPLTITQPQAPSAVPDRCTHGERAEARAGGQQRDSRALDSLLSWQRPRPSRLPVPSPTAPLIINLSLCTNSSWPLLSTSPPSLPLPEMLPNWLLQRPHPR